MDWENIEREFEKHTQSRICSGVTSLSFGSGSARDENQSPSMMNQMPLQLPAPPAHTGTMTLMNEQEPKHSISKDSYEPEYLMRELKSLRHSSKQQSAQIESMERLLLGQSKTSSFVHSDLQARISVLEKENEQIGTRGGGSAGAPLTNTAVRAAREYDEMILKRITALEATSALLTQGDSQTDNIGHALGTTIDHLYTVSSVAEQARGHSMRSAALVDALLRALYTLGNADVTSSLDFLANLSSIDEGHRDLIIGLLTDSIQTAITISVQSQIGTATECLRELFTPQMTQLGVKLNSKQAELHTKIHTVGTRTENALARVEERMTRLQNSHDLLDADAKTLSESVWRARNADREELTALRELISTHTAKIQQLTKPVQQNYRDSREDVIEQVQTLQAKLDALAVSHQTLQVSSDDSIFDLQNSIEKRLKQVEALSVAGKEETAAVKQSNQKMQLILEQQTGELYKRFAKLEAKKEKEKAVGVPASDDAIKAVSSELDSLRQSVANIIFDVDDLKAQLRQLEQRQTKYQDDHEKAQTDSLQSVNEQHEQVSQKIRLFESTLRNVQAGMDTLQDEVVSLSAPQEKKSARNIDISQVDASSILSPRKRVFQQSVETAQITEDEDAYMESFMEDDLEVEEETQSGSVSGTESENTRESRSDAQDMPPLLQGQGRGQKQALAEPTEVASTNKSDDEEAITEKNAVAQAKAAVMSPEKNLAAVTQDSESSATGDVSVEMDTKIVESDTIKTLNASPEMTRNSTSSSSNSSDSETSMSESFQSESSDESEEDIIGKSPPRGNTSATGGNNSIGPKHSSPPGPTPSDVLADQLRLRATYEREQALKNVTAKRLSAAAGVASLSTISGPPLGAVTGLDTKITSDASQLKVMSPKPVLSGSLLSGRRNVNAASSAGGPGTRHTGPGKPLFESSFGATAPMAADTHKKGGAMDDPQLETSLNATAMAARRTATAGASTADKRETIQCTHCLRRVSRNDMVQHNAICELRTEMCPNGCGAKVRAIKLEVHLKECPHKK